MKPRLTVAVSIRLTKAMRTALVRKAKKETDKELSDVLRDLIHAYIEDRFIITPQTVVQSPIGESK